MNNSEEYNHYEFVVENLKDIVWEMDANFIFTYVSSSAKEAIGYETYEAVGRCMFDFLTPESKKHVLAQWEQRVNKNDNLAKVILYDIQFLCKDGKIIWFEVSVTPIIKENSIVGYIGISRDISEKKARENELEKYISELKLANEKLEELATFDMLTGAYNRRKFEYFTKLSIEKKEKYGSPFSIIMLDIDHFKRINDFFGHKTGDLILQETAIKVRTILREADKMFRWGGDEFIILLTETHLKSTYNVAEKVRRAIESYDFGLESNITLSSGIGEYRTAESIEQFVSCVDNALLRAKANGRNKVEIR